MTCAATTCERGHDCVESAEGAKCVPATGEAGEACGKVQCAEGLSCCNASCGLCTAPGEGCIEIDCGDGGPSCADVDCEEGSHCKLVEVTCVAPPCDPVPQCVPNERPCNLVDCPEGTYCDDISGQAECLKAPSCDTVRCGNGEHCELVEVQCIRAPCPPQPMCVKNADCADLDCETCAIVDGKAQCLPAECIHPCAAILCAGDRHCEGKSVTCVKEPCCPVGECVPNDVEEVPCGKSTCTGGQVCCNESCGVCTEPGGVCTQMICP